MRNYIHFLVYSLISFPLLLAAQNVTISEGTNVTIENGWKIKITNGGNLLLSDTPNASASLIDRNSTSQVIFEGGGEADVQLFLKEDQWHYVGTPVANAISGSFWDIYLKQFNEPDSSWSYIISPDQTLVPFEGYAVWASSANTGDTTVTMRGALNAGTFSKTLTNTGNAAHNSNGFNFMGNPFASPINWQVGSAGWTRSNLDPTIYLWNPEIGQYGSYNRNTKTGTNDVDSIIPAKQGFFVHVSSSGTGSLGVNYNAQVHANKSFFKSTQEDIELPLIGLVVSNNVHRDETIILFEENSTSGFDNNLEAFKLVGIEEAPQLYTMNGNIPLAMSAYKAVTHQLAIPLYFKAGTPGIHELSVVKFENFNPDQGIWLEDLKENILTDLKQNPTYVFSGLHDEDPARFILHFKQVSAVEDQEQLNHIQIYAHMQTIYVNLPQDCKGVVEVFNPMGQLLLSNSAIEGLNKISVNQNHNYFIVRVISEKYIQSKKLFINK